MSSPDREELTDAVTKIQSPMLVVAGDLNWLAPNARALSEAVPGARLHMVKNSPHNVYYETAEEYNRVVAEFLAEHGLMPALSQSPDV